MPKRRERRVLKLNKKIEKVQKKAEKRKNKAERKKTNIGKRVDIIKLDKGLFKCIWEEGIIDGIHEWITLRSINEGSFAGALSIFFHKEKMPWNLYTPGMDFGKHFHNFQFIHYVLKPKIIYPLATLLEKFCRKSVGDSLQEAGENQHYNINFKIFDKSVNDAMHDWVYYYIQNRGSGEIPNRTNEECEEWIKNKAPAKVIAVFKKFLLAFCLNDSAYREFFNILMYKITKNMNNEYRGKIKHLFYTCGDTMDVAYYTITRMFDAERRIMDVSVNRLEDDGKKVIGGKQNGKGTSVCGTAIPIGEFLKKIEQTQLEACKGSAAAKI